ncbi:hypothetical protein OIU78_003853 [Salix suchowensis]|nr:hypothetical protein OIU78_003853 [Salix suchowensis]
MNLRNGTRKLRRGRKLVEGEIPVGEVGLDGRGRFGWSNGDNFWPEAQQTSLAVLGIIAMYLVVAKGDLILAVIFNPLLYALRGTRNGLTLISSKILRNASVDSPSDFSNALKNGVYAEVSAKESVKRKWGSD